MQLTYTYAFAHGPTLRSRFWGTKIAGKTTRNKTNDFFQNYNSNFVIFVRRRLRCRFFNLFRLVTRLKNTAKFVRKQKFRFARANHELSLDWLFLLLFGFPASIE